MIDMRQSPITPEFDWRRAERALVSLGQPAVGVGVVLMSGLLVTAARAALKAAVVKEPCRLTIKLTAIDDRKWRGAAAGVLTMENGMAALGHAGWLDSEETGALDRLLQERLAADVAVLHDTVEITIAAPLPNGSWLRLPAGPYTDRLLVVRATPLAGCEVVFELLDGAPAFTEGAQLVGFVHVVRSPVAGRLITFVLRVDATLAAGTAALDVSSAAA